MDPVRNALYAGLVFLALTQATGQLLAADITGQTPEEAVAVTVTIKPTDDRPRPAPELTTEVTIVLLPASAEESGNRLVDRTITETLGKNPSAQVDVVCVTGGGETAKDCEATEKRIEKLGEKDGVSFETVAAPVKSTKKPSDWKKALAIIRSVANGTAVSVTVGISKGADPLSAAFVGMAAGAWSAGMQYWNHEYLNWLTGQAWFKVHDTARATVRRSFMKKAVSTGIYALMMSSAFAAAGINHHFLSLPTFERMGLMVGESLFTQTYWQALNHKWTADAIRADPERAHIYKRLSGIGSLVQSLVNVTANALNIGGGHAGSIIAGTVGTAGLVIYYWDCLKPSELVRKLSLAKDYVRAKAAEGCRIIAKLAGRLPSP